MIEFSTPMMKQYRDIKKKYSDCLMLYRMGDFYELFLEDAIIGSQILNITLTKKAGGKDGQIPMAGVPYHAVDTYLSKLVKAGYKVAICEQLSPPNKRGLVERDVVRVVTPGTLLDENSLDKKENNYIIALTIEGNILAISAADISTGFFTTGEFVFEDLSQVLSDELSKLKPSECILPEDLYNDGELLKILKQQHNLHIFPYLNWQEITIRSKRMLKKHFGVSTLASFGIEQKPYAIKTSAVLLTYLKETQKGNVSHIKKISSFEKEDGLILDRSSLINLELFSTIRDHETKGTLLSVLDQTVTAMGGRLLKTWIKKPLVQKDRIEERYDALEYFVKESALRDKLRENLKEIPDIERLLSRLSVNLGNARDLVNLKISLQSVLYIKSLLEISSVPYIKKIAKNISPSIKKVITYIDEIIVEEPPIGIKEGRMIQSGVNKKLDMLRSTINNSKDWILELETEERKKTGINSLKIKFNKVFGFYIEISNSNLHLVPSTYNRKQTLVNAERYITKELKEHEEIILNAEEKINEIEYALFTEALEYVLRFTEEIQIVAHNIGILDCILNFSYISEKNKYIRPTLLYSGEIKIQEGRHPVVETLLEDKQFVPNTVTLDNVSQQLLIITGPNMAGKSVFIRQVALLVLMAQIGCFVPAKSAHISIVDRIFVRSGASDVITSGLSTFMVEMVETAHILHFATKKSLIIMDEIGRGTSTYDGISIAKAVAEYLVTNSKPSPKTLFATHYHELQKLEEEYPNQIKNFHLSVIEEKGEPVFLHSILPGGASHSFGVQVAKLAGVPKQVIDRAFEILQTLEFRDVEKGKEYNHLPVVLNSFKSSSNDTEEIISHIQNDSVINQLLLKEIEQLDIGNITPLEALNKLAELKNKFKMVQFQNKKYLESD